MIELTGKYNDCKIFTDLVDQSTISQLIELLNQPFTKDSQIRVMPDCHQGNGCVIGTTMTLKDKVPPYLTGCDIGCGAVSAKKNKLLMIPINMRDGILMCVGKGNEDWNCSAPHGAGRIMSRSQAKEAVNMDDFTKTMDGIFSTSINESTKDESPFAYKPMASIVDNIEPTVHIEKIIWPIYNFKASN